MKRVCTCLGACRGSDGLGPLWICALETCPTCGSELRGSFPLCIDCQVVEALKSADAVDPHATDTGKPSTRV
jgi:hypothetical protein